MKTPKYRCPICHAKEGTKHGDNCDEAGDVVVAPRQTPVESTP